VALTPAAVATLVKKGFTINVEDGAGLESKFRNEDYTSAGARVVDKGTAFHSGYNMLCHCST
jgi:NAD/NADP transhydrogenase alpha subunit